MAQFLTPLTEPLANVWCLMVLALIWFLWRRCWRSALWMGIPTVLLFLLGSTPLAERLVDSEERQWEGSFQSGNILFEKQKPDVVVSLGGGLRLSNNDSLGFAVSDGGSRLLTAIELYRSGKVKTLVLGGSWPMPDNSNRASMEIVQDWLMGSKWVAGNVTNLGICINTHDEAISFKNLSRGQGWSNIVLVTSALHMKRSVAVFKKQGIEVIPLAADFHVAGIPKIPNFSPFPIQGRLDLLSLYLHEKIGWSVYRLRGWL